MVVAVGTRILLIRSALTLELRFLVVVKAAEICRILTMVMLAREAMT